MFTCPSCRCHHRPLPPPLLLLLSLLSIVLHCHSHHDQPQKALLLFCLCLPLPLLLQFVCLFAVLFLVPRPHRPSPRAPNRLHRLHQGARPLCLSLLLVLCVLLLRFARAIRNRRVFALVFALVRVLELF